MRCFQVFLNKKVAITIKLDNNCDCDFCKFTLLQFLIRDLDHMHRHQANIVE